ncbi:M15 family metallopeptidase [Hephaestia sp. GCM10023244]|uniref:M15 family metallopeptidase n=1 Tax=unclassified Hephaestia TaxID=2631281 RepID=UPI002076DDA2|nr:M15 family metallopeptidase [Hephaestia sp. MAHUQ-44]MCM8731753.1 M15 family metallopeptidase [Hephaestia sp. MAHUQ-44]
MPLRFAFTAVTLIAAAPALAGQAAPPRLYGHLAYPDADPTTLVEAPTGFAVRGRCLLRPEVLPDLTALIAAAQAAGVPGTVQAASCYRSAAHQNAVFCATDPEGQPRCNEPARRAMSVAPPGHSEHSTGFAIDFTTRPSPGCDDVEYCFDRTPLGQWLLAHATDYGFELSFPWKNSQSVTWEPWHWRWVGRSATEPGARAARMLFTTARADFPAKPRLPNLVVRVVSQPPVPETD